MHFKHFSIFLPIYLYFHGFCFSLTQFVDKQHISIDIFWDGMKKKDKY